MDDLEFVRRLCRKDKRSWEQFIVQYSRLIYSSIHSVLRSKGLSGIGQDVINDLFQEIFLFITQDNYRKLRSFSARNGCKFSSWLHQVVVHRVLDFTRSHKPLVSLDAQNEEGDSLLETIKDERALANDLAIEQEKLRELADCINLLNNEDKYFLRLYLGRDLSPQELMVALRASRGAVDMRKARILGRLRDCFASKGYPC